MLAGAIKSPRDASYFDIKIIGMRQETMSGKIEAQGGLVTGFSRTKQKATDKQIRTTRSFPVTTKQAKTVFFCSARLTSNQANSFRQGIGLIVLFKTSYRGPLSAFSFVGVTASNF